MSVLNVTMRRHEEQTMSEHAYMSALGFFTSLGLGLTALVAWYTISEHINIGLGFILGMILPFVGIMVVNATRKWQVAIVGYLLVAVPFGVLMGATLVRFRLTDIVTALAITAVVSTGMWIVGSIWPPIVRDLSGYIFGALIALIVAMVASFFLPGMMSWIAWLGAFLFTGLIVYDINKAMQSQRNTYNAVSNSLNMYLDIINLFDFVLDIVGRR